MNANVLISIALVTTAALITAAAIYMDSGFADNKGATAKDFCDKLGEEFAEMCSEIEGSVGLENVLLHEKYSCAEDGSEEQVFSLDEIFSADDPVDARDQVLRRCLTEDQYNFVVSGGEGAFDPVLEGEEDDDFERALVNILPGYGWCGSKHSNNWCSDKGKTKTGECTDGDNGGLRCKTRMSFKCCAEHDKCLNKDSSAAVGKQCDKDLASCVKDGSGCKHWHHAWCWGYKRTLLATFNKEDDSDLPNNVDGRSTDSSCRNKAQSIPTGCSWRCTRRKGWRRRCVAWGGVCDY